MSKKTNSLNEIQKSLRSSGDKKIAEHSQKFFKTAKGEYGEGDKFLGIRVPIIRKLTSKYKNISLNTVKSLLQSKYHEERLFALIMLVEKFNKGSSEEKNKIFNLYLKNTKYINNWDLVDCSALYIVGRFIEDRDKKTIFDLARSDNLWERRISIISTFYIIKKNKFTLTFKIAEILKNDKEDLIHKAVGWMLREVGKRNLGKEKAFLKKYYKEIPRTMLRYAIEKFPNKERKKYLRGEI